jgi:hypothetical protein
VTSTEIPRQPRDFKQPNLRGWRMIPALFNSIQFIALLLVGRIKSQMANYRYGTREEQK